MQLSWDISIISVKDYSGVEVGRKRLIAKLDGLSLPHVWFFPSAATDADAKTAAKTSPGGLTDKGYVWDSEV